MDIEGFEKAFKEACVKHNVRAAFVLVKSRDEKGSLLVVGGASEVSGFVEKSLLPNTVEFAGARQ